MSWQEVLYGDEGVRTHQSEGGANQGSLENVETDHGRRAGFGQPDIFSFVNVGDEKALSDLVISKIHTIEGVEETDTHIVAEA